MKTLESRTKEIANLYLPDATPKIGEMSFKEVDVGSLLEEEPEWAVVTKFQEDTPYVFTDWSRSQLLSLLGTREKWFTHVTKQQEAEELNQRAHVLSNYRIKLMKFPGGDGVRVVRGVVSNAYADISNVDIMKALTSVMPNGYCVANDSGQTDRAFYAYIITDSKVEIPGTGFSGYSGVVVKNSEVGYTSLWLVPIIWFPRFKGILSFKSEAALRRIHRGSIDLNEKFVEALEAVKGLWGDLSARTLSLQKTKYQDEAEAIQAITSTMERVGADRAFAYRCEQIYKASHNTSHTGLTLLEAVLKALSESNNQDLTYDRSELAGALLFHITKHD